MKNEEKAQKKEWEVDSDDEKNSAHWNSEDLIQNFIEITTLLKQQQNSDEKIPFLFQPVTQRALNKTRQLEDVTPECETDEECKNLQNYTTPRMETAKEISEKCAKSANPEDKKIKIGREKLMGSSSSESNLRDTKNNPAILLRISTLYEKHKKALEKLRQKKNEILKDEDKECTFKPNLTLSKNRPLVFFLILY